MKKRSTIAAKPSKKILQQRLTIGLDPVDRNSWCYMLDESGQIQREQCVRTHATALREVFSEMRTAGLRSRSGRIRLDQSLAQRVGAWKAISLTEN